MTILSPFSEHLQHAGTGASSSHVFSLWSLLSQADADKESETLAMHDSKWKQAIKGHFHLVSSANEGREVAIFILYRLLSNG